MLAEAREMVYPEHCVLPPDEILLMADEAALDAESVEEAVKRLTAAGIAEFAVGNVAGNYAVPLQDDIGPVDMTISDVPFSAMPVTSLISTRMARRLSLKHSVR